MNTALIMMHARALHLRRAQAAGRNALKSGRQALRRGHRVARQGVERRHNTTAELVDLRKRVHLAASVLRHEGLIVA